MIDIKEMFDSVGETYCFKTNEEYDNIGSMSVFLNDIDGLGLEHIRLDDGTMVVLQHMDYNFYIRLDSGGDGDFYHHRIDTSIYVE